MNRGAAANRDPETITFLNSVFKPDVIEPIGLYDFLDNVRTGVYRSRVNDARRLYEVGNKKDYEKLKISLPAVCFAGTFKPKAVNIDFVKSSGVLPIDIDNLGENLVQIDTIIRGLDCCLFSFVSVSGNGLRVGLRVRPDDITNDVDFKKIFNSAYLMFKNLGIEVDPSGKDVSRKSFVSDDHQIFINEDATVFDWRAWVTATQEQKPKLEKPKAETPKVKKPSISNGFVQSTADECVGKIKNLLIKAKPGERHAKRLEAARLAGGFVAGGLLTEQEALDALKSTSDAIADDGITSETERQTLQDGFEWGKKAPISEPSSDAVNTEPLFRVGQETGKNSFKAEKTQDTEHPEGVGDKWKKKLAAHVTEFNKTHASVLISGQHRILRIEKSKGRYLYRYFKARDIDLIYANTCIKVGERVVNNKTVDVFANYFMAWFKHPKSRSYTGGMLFMPNQAVPENCLNIWHGFIVEPEENDKITKPIWEHVEKIICAGNVEQFTYFRNWLASIFQNPDKQGEVVIVMRGLKGCGKGTINHFIMNLWGVHGLYISNPKHLVGSFNAHLADCCLLFADEAFFSHDKAHESILKALATEPLLMIEPKGIDPYQSPNFLKIIMSTNAEYAVPSSSDERRWCVLDVSPDRISNVDYFTKLKKACNDPKVQAAFLYEMLHTDLSNFNLRKVPETAGLRAQRYHSMKAHQKWLVDSLVSGKFDGVYTGCEDKWAEEIPSKHLYDSYVKFCNENHIGEYGRITQTALGIYLTKLFTKYKKGVKRYCFGSLENAVLSFEKHEKVSLDELDIE